MGLSALYEHNKQALGKLKSFKRLTGAAGHLRRLPCATARQLSQADGCGLAKGFAPVSTSRCPGSSKQRLYEVKLVAAGPAALARVLARCVLLLMLAAESVTSFVTAVTLVPSAGTQRPESTDR